MAAQPRAWLGLGSAAPPEAPEVAPRGAGFPAVGRDSWGRGRGDRGTRRNPPAPPPAPAPALPGRDGGTAKLRGGGRDLAGKGRDLAGKGRDLGGKGRAWLGRGGALPDGTLSPEPARPGEEKWARLGPQRDAAAAGFRGRRDQSTLMASALRRPQLSSTQYFREKCAGSFRAKVTTQVSAPHSLC